MRRGLVVSIAALMVAGGLGVAAPAHARDSQPLPCPYGPTSPGLQSAYIDENGVVHVDPFAAPSDADAYGAWAVDYALYWYTCMANKPVLDSVWCQYAIALEIVDSMDPLSLNLRYVYPSGTGYAINVPLLLSDAGRSARCHITAQP